MSMELSKKPASVLRTYTQQVRNHAGAMQRLQDQYFAALKRAEAQYFEGVKRITDEVTADATAAAAPEPQQASAEAGALS
jgi:hypothetical protein